MYNFIHCNSGFYTFGRLYQVLFQIHYLQLIMNTASSYNTCDYYIFSTKKE